MSARRAYHAAALLQRASRMRLDAMVLLALAAVAIAVTTLLGLISLGQVGIIVPVTFGYLGSAIMVLAALTELSSARRLERRVMDRVGS